MTAARIFGRAWARRRLVTLKRLGPELRRRIYDALPRPAVRALQEEWWWQAHGGQIEPEGDWRIWSLVAGRGFGKTRAGAEWVWQRARDNPGARIALVAASLDEVVKVLVKGETGLFAVARSGEEARWVADHDTFYFPSGAMAFACTAERPARLRGPAHHFAWCDELAKWPNAGETWDMLMMGLRLGDRPRAIVTTTPQPVPVLKRILGLPRCVTTRGRTDENPHSPADFRAAMAEMYGDSRLGRQELDGILFDDPEGALWTREMLEAGRPDRPFVPSEIGGRFVRIVIGVDPPASATGDACGIIVCGLDEEGVAWVLADLTVAGLRPEGWARRVAGAAELWRAQLIVAEKNQGGEMIGSVLRGVDSALPVRLVHADRGKAARAEPVALRFETGRARLAGTFPELEDELCAMTYGGYQGPGSPDRADAMVWAMTELIGPARGPRIRML